MGRSRMPSPGAGLPLGNIIAAIAIVSPVATTIPASIKPTYKARAPMMRLEDLDVGRMFIGELILS